MCVAMTSSSVPARGPPAPVLSRGPVELVYPLGVAPEQLLLALGPQAQLADLARGALEVDDREVGAEQHLVLAPAIDEVDELGLPVARRVGVGADVHVGV